MREVTRDVKKKELKVRGVRSGEDELKSLGAYRQVYKGLEIYNQMRRDKEGNL